MEYVIHMYAELDYKSVAQRAITAPSTLLNPILAIHIFLNFQILVKTLLSVNQLQYKTKIKLELKTQ